MSEKEILKKLNLLGVSSSTQIKGPGLYYYWQIKYKEIKESQLKEETIKEKLIEINEIYEELSKLDEKLLVEIINKYSKEEKIVNSDVDLYNLGLELFNEKEYEISIKKFSEAIDLNYEDPDYFNLRGLAYYNLKNYDKAIEDATKAIDLDPNDPAYFNLRGWAYYQLDNEDKAIEDATKAIDLDPNDPRYFYLRGWAYYQLDNEDKAIEDANKAIDLDPNDPEYFKIRGDSYYRLEKYEQAIEDLNKVIDLDPNDPRYFYLRGRAYYRLKNYDKAIEDANKAIDLDPNDPDYLNLRKLIEDATKVNESECSYLKKIRRSFVNCDYEKAILQCNEAISLNNKIADYFYYRGLSKQYSNKVYKNNSILNDFNIAIDLNPNNPYIWASRGSLKVQIDYNGNYIESAIEDISKAIEINSKKAEFYYRSGHAKFFNEQEEDALVDLNKAIKLDPHNNEGYLNDCLKLIEEINGFNNSTKEDGFGYVFLAKSINSQDKYRIGTATDKGDLKRKVGNDSLVVSSKECEGYEQFATVLHRRYKNNRIGNSEYFLLNDVQYDSVMTSILRSFSKDDPKYGSGFLSDLFTD